MAKDKEGMNFTTEILSDMKRRLIICRAALMVSLIGNIILATILIFR